MIPCQRVDMVFGGWEYRFVLTTLLDHRSHRVALLRLPGGLPRSGGQIVEVPQSEGV